MAILISISGNDCVILEAQPLFDQLNEFGRFYTEFCPLRSL